MATQIPNEFTSYFLNEEEVSQGSLLTITQKQVIQNQLSLLASEKMAIEFDTEKSNLSFVQQEAYKRGQMDSLRYILACSEAEEEMKQPPPAQ